MSHCGIDFGTSNSSIGVHTSGRADLIRFSGESATTPSAVFYSVENSDVLYGRSAVSAYTSGRDGRLLRSLKSVLGSSLIDEKTRVGQQNLAFRDIIRDYLGYLKSTLDAGHACASGASVDSVVIGRPVHFVDGDEAKDRAAQSALHGLARELGFRHIEFQFEPIAAALAYESTAAREGIALIVDIGGGTADFSIIQIQPPGKASNNRYNDILATMGIHIGGTDIDRKLSMVSAMPLLGYGSLTRQTHRELPSSIYFDLATWHKIQTLYSRETLRLIESMRLDAAEPARLDRLAAVVRGRHGHALAGEVEAAKIRLSTANSTMLELFMLDSGAEVSVTRLAMEQAIAVLVDQLDECIREGMRAAQLEPGDISVLFFTGGTSSIGVIRNRITQLFPGAEVIQGDEFGSVGIGLAIDAYRKFA